MSTYEEIILQYRNKLSEYQQKSHEHYDKSLLTLSFGSIVVSVTFVKSIFPEGQFVLHYSLAQAWILWLLSAMAVLFSFIASQRSTSKMIKQIDAGIRKDLGGRWKTITEWVNYASGVLYLAGVISMLYFTLKHLK